MKLMSHIKRIGVIVFVLFIAKSAWPDVLPGPVLPEQVGKALQSERPKAAPEVLPPIVAPAETSTTPLGPEAEKIKFKLNGVILKGNRIYTAQQLEPIYRDKLHKLITVAELFKIVQDITNFYRNNGYIISRAILPPQHVKSGVVTIQIIEGYIGNVDVSGDPKGAKCLVKAYGERIKSCPPLRIAHMERYLLLANEIPATQVRAVLAPSKTKTGAADLTLVTDNTPLTGYLSYDNYGTRYIGPQQMTGSASANSFFASGDAVQFTMTKTPKGGELTYTDLNYNLPLWDNGMRWLLGDTRVMTHPMFVLQPNDIDGLSTNYYTSLQFPAIRTRTESLTWQINFNYLDSYVTTLDEPLYTDHLRNLGFGMTYSFADQLYGSNLIYAEVRQGLPIWGYTSDTSLTAQTSRPGGHANYTKFAGQYSRLQAIKGPFSFYGLIKGQTALVALLASEQYTFGGSQLGRGYDPAELIGDRGLGGTLELRYDWDLPQYMIPNFRPLIPALQLYVFYDIGAIWNIEVNETSPAKVSASSTGFGTRFYYNKYVSGNVMWAQPLTKQVAAEQFIGEGWRPRVFFSIVVSFA